MAFSIDMYGAGKHGETPEQAQALMMSVMSDPAALETRFNAALKIVRRHPRADSAKIAALGYYFGGGVVLYMARKGVDLAGVISMHGTLSSPLPARPGSVRAPLRIYTGGADPFVPAEQVNGFVAEMQAAGVRFDLVSFPGVQHAFTNPEATALGQCFGLPLAYDAAADGESWAGLQGFLAMVFGDRPGRRAHGKAAE